MLEEGINKNVLAETSWRYFTASSSGGGGAAS